MGHSMGGGASLLAAGSDPSVTAIVNFAAANTNPSDISACADITTPVLLFSGSEDCVTPPSQHREIMFDSLASSSRFAHEHDCDPRGFEDNKSGLWDL